MIEFYLFFSRCSFNFLLYSSFSAANLFFFFSFYNSLKSSIVFFPPRSLRFSASSLITSVFAALSLNWGLEYTSFLKNCVIPFSPVASYLPFRVNYLRASLIFKFVAFVRLRPLNLKLPSLTNKFLDVAENDFLPPLLILDSADALS